MRKKDSGVQRRVRSQRGLDFQEDVIKGIGFELSPEIWFVLSKGEKRRGPPERRNEQNGSLYQSFPKNASSLLSIN